MTKLFGVENAVLFNIDFLDRLKILDTFLCSA